MSKIAKKGKESEPVTASFDWNPEERESWFIEFEKEAVNDERWSCAVTAAIPNEVADDECLQIYRKCVATGLRKAIKIITMQDVVYILRGKVVNPPTEIKKNVQPKETRKGKTKAETAVPVENDDTYMKFLSFDAPIVELARKYAVYTNQECQLPPLIMAALIKYIILTIKQESIYKKKINFVRERKARQYKLKLKFISEILKNESPEMSASTLMPNQNQSLFLDIRDPVDDEPLGGPDLYIMLIDFYNPLYFSELQNVRVPFLALLQIRGTPKILSRGSMAMSRQSDFGKIVNSQKSPLITNFWDMLKKDFSVLKNPEFLKNILLIDFQMRALKSTDIKIVHNLTFDELSWLQYSSYNVFRQHQNYLKEMSVQRMIVSLEPLDLIRCEMYNMLCDTLITGEPSTVLIVLYAMVEQVVVGVPYTQSVAQEYELHLSEFFSGDDGVNSSSESVTDTTDTKKFTIVTPCTECRNKYNPETCGKAKTLTIEDPLSGVCSESLPVQKKSVPLSVSVGEASNVSSASNPSKGGKSKTCFKKQEVYENLVNQVVFEKLSEKTVSWDKKWKTPALSLYGDNVTFDMFHCDKRFLDSSTLFERFLKRMDVCLLWTRYQEMKPENKAYYNYQFNLLWKKTPHSLDFLKFKIFFALSMKLIGITKSQLFQGEEDTVSEMFESIFKERTKRLSTRVDRNALSAVLKSALTDASRFTFTKVTADKTSINPRRTTFKIGSSERLARAVLRNAEQHFNTRSHFNIFLNVNKIDGTSIPLSYKALVDPSFHGEMKEESMKLYGILDCLEISTLPEYNFVMNKEEILHHIDGLKYFEVLEPARMVQRLIDAEENYNSTQCLYFPPTDTIILVMHNDCDHRGLFFSIGYGKLLTPITLRDFYKYVYSDISEWLANEESEYNKAMEEQRRKETEMEEKKDEQYLSLLNKKYQAMSEEEKMKFLKTELQPPAETDVLDDYLDDLPKKFKPPNSNRISFYTTYLTDVQMETHKNIQEFLSKDGTQVIANIDAWTYGLNSQLFISVNKSNLKLQYYLLLEQKEINQNFTLRTSSDIVFFFHKTEDDFINNDETQLFVYDLSISWPTGLLIQTKKHPTLGVYVRQNYISVYRKGWEIRDEMCRCYLRNGQILIFKENGSVEILCASGSIIYFRDPGKKINKNNTSKERFVYEVISTLGEKWEKQIRSSHKKKEKLTHVYKIYMATDNKTLEVYYRRDDGVNSMLWPNGKLVTCYPDGTKITSIPEFEESEIFVDWDEEQKGSVEGDVKPSSSKKNEINSSQNSDEDVEENEGFVSVSVSYFQEHPKYARVSFIANENTALLRMVDDLSVRVDSQGTYEVRQKSQVLNVGQNKIEFYSECSECHTTSVATLRFDSEPLLEFVDLYQKRITVNRMGELLYQDDTVDYTQDNSFLPQRKCKHEKKEAYDQRYFAFERDLSGVEILHSEFLARYCYNLTKETFFDLDSKHPTENLLSHTFCVPFDKVGYENWVMEYEDQNDGLPTSIKKKDMKEQGKKESYKNLYKQPFPRKQEWDLCSNRQVQTKAMVNMPKIIVARTVKCITDKPISILQDLQEYVNSYREEARNLYEKYKSGKIDCDSEDESFVTKTLKNISRALKVPTYTHPYLHNVVPLTETDIHNTEHSLKLKEQLQSHFKNEAGLPQCKFIPRSLPRKSIYTPVMEDNTSPGHHLT